MKTRNIHSKTCFLPIALAGLMTTLGCRPSIHEVVRVISTLPLGVSRTEVWKTLVNQYPKQVWPYELANPALPLTEGQIQAAKNVIEVTRKEGGFVRVYPIDLLDKMPANGYSDMIGMIRESTIGGGSLTVIYDSNTNYIGFLAASYK
jgi:hypothetical protein